MPELAFELFAPLAPTDLSRSQSAEAYARQLAQLLPRGVLWRLEQGSWLTALLLAIGDELARTDDRGDRLIAEWDPRSALETLEDWERVLGLVPVSADDTVARQVAAARQLAMRGGQTAAYFIELAARLGFVATIAETAAHTWRMDVDLAASSATYTLRTNEARAGTARAGDRVASRDVAELEAVILREKPAHTVVTFNYS